MEKFAIMTDSASDIRTEFAEKYNIKLVRFIINYEDKSYRDGVDIQPEDVYKNMEKQIPSTSYSMEEFNLSLNELRNEGYKKVLLITISHAMSGFNNAVNLFKDTIEDMEIEVVDSLSVAIGEGFLSIYASNLRKEGKSFEETVEKVRNAVKNSKLYFSPKTLDYLAKGGRIGKVSAMAGKLLNINPIISSGDDGMLFSLEKVRGAKKVKSRICELAENNIAGHEKYYLGIMHGSNEDDILEIRERLKPLAEKAEVYVEDRLTPCIAVHGGPEIITISVFTFPID